MTTQTSDQIEQADRKAERKRIQDAKELSGKLTLAVFVSIASVIFMNPTMVPGLANFVAKGSYMEGLVWSILGLISVPVLMWSASHLFTTMRADLKQGTINFNTVLTVVISAAFAYSLALVIVPGVQAANPTARPFWDVIAVVLTLLVFKKWATDRQAS